MTKYNRGFMYYIQAYHQQVQVAVPKGKAKEQLTACPSAWRPDVQEMIQHKITLKPHQKYCWFFKEKLLGIATTNTVGKIQGIDKPQHI